MKIQGAMYPEFTAGNTLQPDGALEQRIFDQIQQEQNGGLAELQALKENPQIDMGSIKSRDLGNMLSGELVRLGETAAKALNPEADFGDLPSRALSEMGKTMVNAAIDADAESGIKTE